MSKDIMDSIVYSYSHAYCGNCYGHHIQWNRKNSHQTKTEPIDSKLGNKAIVDILKDLNKI